MQLIKGLTLDEFKRHLRQSNGRNIENRPDTNRHLIELMINQGNSFNKVMEHVFRKVELFLFKLAY